MEWERTYKFKSGDHVLVDTLAPPRVAAVVRRACFHRGVGPLWLRFAYAPSVLVMKYLGGETAGQVRRALVGLGVLDEEGEGEGEGEEGEGGGCGGADDGAAADGSCRAASPLLPSTQKPHTTQHPAASLSASPDQRGGVNSGGGGAVPAAAASSPPSTSPPWKTAPLPGTVTYVRGGLMAVLFSESETAA